nr:MAG TPA: immunity protein [Caudoviricetes sp.]
MKNKYPQTEYPTKLKDEIIELILNQGLTYAQINSLLYWVLDDITCKTPIKK